MVTEESSVVAAAASGAKFWLDKGNQAKIIGVLKTGQIHFLWYGDGDVLATFKDELTAYLVGVSSHITRNMDERGGGIKQISLSIAPTRLGTINCISSGYQDSMGANFINSVLEECAMALPIWFEKNMATDIPAPEVIMAILSNYTPDCRVLVWVECPTTDLGEMEDGLVQKNLPAGFIQLFAFLIWIPTAQPLIIKASSMVLMRSF
jgi:hydroxymethylglutaryl-CoA reductase